MSLPEQKLDQSLNILNGEEVTDDDLDRAINILADVKEFFVKRREIYKLSQRKYYNQNKEKERTRKRNAYTRKKNQLQME